MRSDDVSSRSHTPFEEFDDELNSFEIGESLPCGLYRCGGGMDGVTGGFGSFCNCMSCGGECFCRSVYGLFADLDSLHQRMLASLRELNFSRRGTEWVLLFAASLMASLMDLSSVVFGRWGASTLGMKTLVLSEMA